MNIIRMTGGLGNQMFQYALYLKLKSMGRKVKLDDVTEYEGREARPIMLWVFGIDYERADKKELEEITDGSLKLTHRIRRKLFGRKTLEYEEKSNFDEQVLIKEPAYLTGYFQSEKYFEDIKDRVREAFTFSERIFEGLDEALIKKVKAYEKEIAGKNAVSLHIRRGDYLASPEVYGNICTEEYYERAIELMREKVPGAHFFVFTNDADYVRKWLKGQKQETSFTIIEGTDEATGYLDLFLMSKCKNHILANSSFSWWGAWLDPSPKKLVIAPKKWFNNKEFQDIYTQDMIKLSGQKSYEGTLISVIVTAYNIQEYLPRCVDSILAQSHKNLEIILVDDGSLDDTPGICDRYAAEYGNVRVIHQENAGPSAARNAGLQIARGEYIGYVDGDDWIRSDMYEEMLRACMETEAQIAICAYEEEGEGAQKGSFSGKRIELTKQQALEMYICGDEQYHIYHSVWSKLFERRVIENIRFPEGRKSEDIMYTTWALTSADKCVFVDMPLYNYRVDRSSSIMNSYLEERRFQDEIPFWKEQKGYLQGLGMQQLSEKAAYQFYRRLLFYYVDFRRRGSKKAGERLVKLLKEEKREIIRVYGEDFAASGDKVRMKLFLFSPSLYYKTVCFYDRVVIPLRNR